MDKEQIFEIVCTHYSEHHCSKGHTIPLRGYCDLMACKDYTPSDGNVCAYLDMVEGDDEHTQW